MKIYIFYDDTDPLTVQLTKQCNVYKRNVLLSIKVILLRNKKAEIVS